MHNYSCRCLAMKSFTSSNSARQLLWAGKQLSPKACQLGLQRPTSNRFHLLFPCTHCGCGWLFQVLTYLLRVCCSKHDCLQVILLGSIDASLRTEAQLEGSQLRYCCNETALREACTFLGLKELEVQSYESYILMERSTVEMMFYAANLPDIACQRMTACISSHIVLHYSPQRHHTEIDNLKSFLMLSCPEA